MISTQLKKCLVVSVSTLSALGLMVLMPYVANAQTSGQTQTGVEGSQTNPDSNSGTGQVVSPSGSAEDMPDATTGGTRSPGTTPDTVTPGMGVGSEEDENIDSDLNSEGIETDGVEADGVNSDGMETESDAAQPGSITVPNSDMPSNTVPAAGDSPANRTTPGTGMEMESDTTQPGSITVPNSNMPSNTVPTTRTTPTPTRTTPSTTTTPSTSNTNSPRALW